MTAEQPAVEPSLPPAAARGLAQAGMALSQGRPDDAERALLAVLALAPDHGEANRLLGIACQMRGDHRRAIEYAGRALASCPQNALFHTNLGSALYESGDVDAALSSLQRACDLAPDLAASWYNLGKALMMQFRAGHASAALRRALDIDPTHTRARFTLADALASLGDIPAAVAHYRELLRREPTNPNAWFALANLKTERFSKEDALELQRVVRLPGMSPDAQVLLGFALAKALEDLHDDAAAFNALCHANALKRQHVKWNALAERRRVEAIMESFGKPLPEPLDTALGRNVIFIVSLPRSGSTLTEQILASHALVEGANEITDLPQIIEAESARRGVPFPYWVGDATAEDWGRMGREYLARTERWRQRRPYSTDKNLVTWQMVGAIMLMLPGAHVVNCRRDPLETCIACYRQLFSNGAHFSYDLTDLANHYQDYDRLCRHWECLFPHRFHVHVHEALLADPEPHIRHLLEFCGLDFDPLCLQPHLTARNVHSTASAAQVRQPLQATNPRGERYGKHYDGLRAQLHEAGLLPAPGARPSANA